MGRKIQAKKVITDYVTHEGDRLGIKEGKNLVLYLKEMRNYLNHALCLIFGRFLIAAAECFARFIFLITVG